MGSPALVACEHFAGEVTAVARDLIGRSLVVTAAGRVACGRILETEAYGGADDPASHAAFRPGGRAAAMFGPPGLVYVYSAYGVYPCFNIVTGPEGVPSAVLIRAVRLARSDRVTSGPGRLTRAMGIVAGDHGQFVDGTRFGVTVEREMLDFVATPRIGITRGVELPWRYVAAVEAERRR